ncbi:MAG: methionine--tRNA ligase [Clostridia bacterium]|nr:methionine--tRNA ligase [Clostridia bacterium]
MAEKYYITTPIYYPSGKWHLGTCYTTVICDALARFKRMQGYDVFYLTGTDEHGQKIEQKAKEANMEPKAYVDMQVQTLVDLWKLLDISYDKFIRTTDDEHVSAVKKIFNKLYEQGDIYKGEYEGWYCVQCESFWTKTQLVDGKCPDCGREVNLTKEESYFFRMTKYQDRLIKLIEENEEFLQPKSRRNEMLNNFLRPGLQDLAVSRNSFKWGIPVEFDPEHVVYVWLDALTNYITALGYMSEDDSNFQKYWPADLHLMGKEIVRFHSITWPALLMALDIPLPKQVYGHGWLTLGGDKISKSKGNIIDPVELCARFGVDAIRYFLLREVPFGQDGMYTNESLLMRINNDLANDLGNLVSRTSAMITQYFDGIIPEAVGEKVSFDIELEEVANALYEKVSSAMDKLNAPDALVEIWKLISRANKYIDETMPWQLNKEGNKERLSRVMYNLSEAIRISAILLKPFLTTTPDKIFEAMGTKVEEQNFNTLVFGKGSCGVKVTKGAPLFPRIDVKKELEAMEKRAEELKAGAEKKVEEKKEEIVENTEITIDDFAKVKLVTAKILSAEPVEKADKLLRLTVDAGEEKPRTVVSGIAKHFTCEELVGKQIVLVANLKPAKLRGIMSEGMILCAEDKEGKLSIIAPSSDIPAGSGVR